ncbi:hypothetical protein ACG04Q_21070 [Roseateles sp. DXS20W]|uniref:Peptidase C58 YopT-type domain-containing protein n=1 Tax=Pelomonas lactea TaxID=3299030 RepID=A0ABW7GQ29_9BURK
MPLDDFKKYEFKQSEVLFIKEREVAGTSAAKGICQELCWKWMKRMHTKLGKYGTPKDRMNALWKESTVDKAIDHHNNPALMKSGAQSGYGIQKGNYARAWGYDMGLVNRWHQKRGGLFISFRYVNDDNVLHAIAFYSPANTLATTLFFFDSNQGEYEISLGMFHKFLPDYLKEKYGSSMSDIVEVFVYGEPDQLV